MRIISASSIEAFKTRFPTLVEFGMMDDAYAVAVLGADKIGCRPCEIRTIRKRRDGSFSVSRFY
jgi:hypothetical protein